MAALEMSKELDALFDRLKKGAELITPAEQSVFATAVKTRRTKTLLKEALESFNDRKREDIEWEAAHCRAYRQELLDDLARSKLDHGQDEVSQLLQNAQQELSETVIM